MKNSWLLSSRALGLAKNSSAAFDQIHFGHHENFLEEMSLVFVVGIKNPGRRDLMWVGSGYNLLQTMEPQVMVMIFN